jgi:hypothetical protein
MRIDDERHCRYLCAFIIKNIKSIMNKIGIFSGSSGGNTQRVASIIAKKIGGMRNGMRCLPCIAVICFSLPASGQEMEKDTIMLNEVTVKARNDRKELTEARRQGVPVSVIDGKSLAGRGTSIVEVINHQTGVKVRRIGGVGSATCLPAHRVCRTKPLP